MEAYLQAAAAQGITPLPPVLTALGHKDAVLDISSNSLPIQQLRRRVGDKDIEALAAVLEHSSILSLSAKCGSITDAGASALAAALPSSLRHLDLRDNDIGTAGALAVIAAVRSRTPNLHSLVLDGNALGKEGGKAIAELIASHSHLQALSVARCELDTDAVLAIADSLSRTTSLRSLDLSEPRLFSRNEESAYHLAKALRANSSLHHLALRKFAYVTDTGVEALCEYLLDNSSLRVLDLSACKIGPPGGATLARTLAAGARLHSLNLSHCRIADDGAVAFARQLSSMTHLVDLNLAHNSIGDEGLTALAAALVDAGCPLQRLHVWGNKLGVGAPGTTALGHALHSAALQRVDVAVYAVDGAVHVGHDA